MNNKNIIKNFIILSACIDKSICEIRNTLNNLNINWYVINIINSSNANNSINNEINKKAYNCLVNNNTDIYILLIYNHQINNLKKLLK